MEDKVKIEYENRRHEIYDLNERILKFLTFTFTIVSALTSWGFKDGLSIAYLLSNLFIIWAVCYITHCRQYIFINASYCNHYLESDNSELHWEKRLQEFRKLYKTIGVRYYEAIFFILLTVFNTVFIFFPNIKFDSKINADEFNMSLIGVISGLISFWTIFILIRGLIITERSNWEEKYSELWKKVDKNLS